MFRGLIFLLGSLILLIGVMDKVQYKEVATTATEVSAKELTGLVERDEEAYVQIKGSLEDKRKIFSSSVGIPVYTACSPETIASISINSDRSRMLGCRVKLSAPLDPRQVEIVSVRKKKLQDDEEKGRYVLAPVMGTELQLWILSPFFEGSNAAGSQRWASQNKYEGVLTKLSDLNENRAGLQKKIEELKTFFQKENSSSVPDDALVIIDSENQGSAYDNFNTGGDLVYVPVAETSFSVYLATKNSDPLPSKIEGVLKPESRENYASFQNALGSEIPARIGIITQWSGAERNAQKQKEGTENVIIGLVLIGFAFVMTYLKKRFRRKKNGDKPS